MTSTNNLVSSISIPANAIDLFPLNGQSNEANINRLGGFGSDLFYDYRQNFYYALVDRGPGGGVIPYETRVEQFDINIDPQTGAINGYQLLKTIPFTIAAGTTFNGITYSTTTPFNGLNPLLLNGDGTELGLSQDPEGFAVGANGNFYVSDEYGPSIYEFSPTGTFIRALTQPDNVIPNFAADGATVTTGRQDNRGYEGLAISPDGQKLFSIFQDPLQNEGTPNGRSSNNVRIVRFDIATGISDAQYIYQLESVADINARITATGARDTFGSTSQGRNIGVSSLTPINDHEFLVIERDNRGIGVDDPTGQATVGSKRIYKIDLTGATNVSDVNLTGTNTLPAGVTPVSKSLFLDIAGSLQNAGEKIPEKFEGVAIGPQLADGSYALIVATDNDFSVTQNSTNTQFDVYTNGVSSIQVPIDSLPPTAPAGQSSYTLLPSSIYSFNPTLPNVSLPTLPSSFNLIQGTEQDDTLYGSNEDDTIFSFGGNDTIYAGEGNNSVVAGNGNNTVYGGAGNDVINVGKDNNIIYAAEGKNSVVGGNGDDLIYAGSGDDIINAGNGNNTIYAAEGNNQITTGNGDDLIYAGSGNDIINAGNGNNTIYAAEGNNQITTGNGDDLIYAGSGNNVISTGTGNDTVYVGSGVNRFILAAGADSATIYNFTSNDQISRGSGLSSNASLTVTISGDDTLISAGSDLLATLKWTQLNSVNIV
jgi:hypothetical protein